MEAIRGAWSWPTDALGRLAARIVPGARRREVAGAVIVEDGRFDRLFRLVPDHPNAMTFGSTVLARVRLDPAIVAHELAHVAQYRRLGPLFFPLYLLRPLCGALRHRHHYLGNPFEVEAMRAAERSRRADADGVDAGEGRRGAAG